MKKMLMVGLILLSFINAYAGFLFSFPLEDDGFYKGKENLPNKVKDDVELAFMSMPVYYDGEKVVTTKELSLIPSIYHLGHRHGYIGVGDTSFGESDIMVGGSMRLNILDHKDNYGGYYSPASISFLLLWSQEDNHYKTSETKAEFDATGKDMPDKLNYGTFVFTYKNRPNFKNKKHGKFGKIFLSNNFYKLRQFTFVGSGKKAFYSEGDDKDGFEVYNEVKENYDNSSSYWGLEVTYTDAKERVGITFGPRFFGDESPLYTLGISGFFDYKGPIKFGANKYSVIWSERKTTE